MKAELKPIYILTWRDFYNLHFFDVVSQTPHPCNVYTHKDYTKPCFLYAVTYKKLIDFDYPEEVLKIGLSATPEIRNKYKPNNDVSPLPETLQILAEASTPQICWLEWHIKNSFTRVPTSHQFEGYTECFDLALKEDIIEYVDNFSLPSASEGLLEKYTERRKKKAEEEKFKRIVKRYKNSPLARHTIREELTYSTRIEKHLESIKSHDDENEILSMKMREDMLYE